MTAAQRHTRVPCGYSHALSSVERNEDLQSGTGPGPGPGRSFRPAEKHAKARFADVCGFRSCMILQRDSNGLL